MYTCRHDYWTVLRVNYRLILNKLDYGLSPFHMHKSTQYAEVPISVMPKYNAEIGSFSLTFAKKYAREYERSWIAPYQFVQFTVKNT